MLMVTTERRQFKFTYGDGEPKAADIRVRVDGHTYDVTTKIEPQGDADHLLLTEIEPKRTEFGKTLHHERISEIWAVLNFCREFAADFGLEFRAPGLPPGEPDDADDIELWAER